MNLKFLFAVIACSLLLGIPAVHASVIKGATGTSVTKSLYAPNETLGGFLNLSLKDELSGGNITLKLGALTKSISLLEFFLLQNMSSPSQYLCNPLNCKGTYEILGAAKKSTQLSQGVNLLGMQLNGKNIEFKASALDFGIAGNNNEQTCGSSPITIDVLDDKSIDWQYTKTGSLCGGLIPSPCYDVGMAEDEFDLTDTPYCQKIRLPVANSFRISALVKRNKEGGDLGMFLYDNKTGAVSPCDLPEPVTTAYVEQACTVDFPVLEPNDYYLCIQDSVSANSYAIQSDTVEPLCGFAGLPETQMNATADFGVFAQATGIDAFNSSVRFNESEFAKTHAFTATKYIQDYIIDEHGSDCGSGCIIPLAMSAMGNVALTDAGLSYCSQGLCKTDTNIYDIKRKSPAITMNFTQLSLQPLNISLQSYGNYNLEILIGNTQVYLQNISVERVPIIENLSPTSPAAAVPVIFYVDASSPKNNAIASYEWNFGDSSKVTTTVNYAEHIYATVGSFSLQVKVTDSEGLTNSKIFKVITGSPKEYINLTLSLKKVILANLTQEIEKLPWYKGLVKQALNTDEIDKTLKDYERKFSLAAADADYVGIMNELSQLKLPVFVFESEEVPFLPVITDVDSIAPEYIESMNGGTYDTEYADETKNAIWNWQAGNMGMTLQGKTLSILKEDDSVENILTVFELDVKPKTAFSEAYLVLLLPYDQITFASEAGQQEVSNAAGFQLTGDEKRIAAAVKGKLNLEEIVIFASPNINDLSVIPPQIVCNINKKCEKSLGENTKNCRQDCRPVGLGIFFILIVIAAGAGAYFFLQRWYATRYENYLFKNKQDLYNIMFFVTNSVNKGIAEKEIKEKLRKAGWNAEQVEYAVKKAKGKNTGLPELVKVKQQKKNMKIAPLPLNPEQPAEGIYKKRF